jgi:gamma-glutamyltranspeptidase/glutathione hydrolase
MAAASPRRIWLPTSPEWVTPIGKNYRGYTLHEIPPNGQGIAALIALGILDKFDVGSLPVDGVDSQHLQIEAMKLAFADVYRLWPSPPTWKLPPSKCWMTPTWPRARS